MEGCIPIEGSLLSPLISVSPCFLGPMVHKLGLKGLKNFIFGGSIYHFQAKRLWFKRSGGLTDWHHVHN